MLIKEKKSFLDYLRNIPVLRLLPKIIDYFKHKITKYFENKKKEWINAMLVIFSKLNRDRRYLTIKDQFSAADLATFTAAELELYEMMKTYDEKYYFDFGAETTAKTKAPDFCSNSILENSTATAMFLEISGSNAGFKAIFYPIKFQDEIASKRWTPSAFTQFLTQWHRNLSV